ncbi:MAG: ABC transporter substrate-binding protein [Planctomycetota bacterium]|nr:ABC transporter substrate-binding protein [Planctomycetota bacterium]MDA1140451.1 ABC transporter substrate-binding protein [Planctomycetota bacterium]
MPNYTKYILLFISYAVILGAPFAFRPEGEDFEPETKIRILSPHWEGIKYEFQRGFRDWYLEKAGKKVDIEWLDVGGTSDIKRYLESEYQSNPEGGGQDMVFGGGTSFFVRLKESGFTQAYKLPDEMLALVPQDASGVPIYDPEYHWYGAALSGFGVIYNKGILDSRKIPYPKTWEDLTSPKLFTWLGSADPGKSGSIHMMFEIVLQAYGWEKGLDVLARMGANSRSFADGGGSIPMDVARGENALGMCIDFYAGAKIAEVGDDLIGFVMPKGLTVIDSDPIAILKGSPNLEESRGFVRYVMSEEGQKIWMLRKGAAGGPKRFGLARLSVMPSLYKTDPAVMLIDQDSSPFKGDSNFNYDSKKGGARWQVISDFMRAALIDTHEEAVRAWKAIIDNNFPHEANAILGKGPLTEAEVMELVSGWKDAQFREKTRSGWVKWYREHYRKVKELAESG